MNRIPIRKKENGKYSDLELKRQFKKVKKGHYIHPKSIILQVFNCDTCQWRGTNLCPHKLGKGERHVNNICSQRAMFIKKAFELAGTQIKVFQMEELVKQKFVNDIMFKQYMMTGEMPKTYHHHVKNLIALTDKMRRQDEGIKIAGEINVTFEKFREIVDAQFEEIKDEQNSARGQEKN